MSKKDQRTPEENATFKYIRQEINTFVIQEYGYHYLKPSETNAHWLAVMPYKPELVEALLNQVTNILNRQTTNKNPGFMLHVIADIAYFLSQYVNKKPDSINRNQTTNELKRILIQKNAVLQGKYKKTPEERKERKRIKAQTAKKIHSQVNGLFQDMQNDYKYHWGR